jgi:hypothetical protein
MSLPAPSAGEAKRLFIAKIQFFRLLSNYLHIGDLLSLSSTVSACP